MFPARLSTPPSETGSQTLRLLSSRFRLAHFSPRKPICLLRSPWVRLISLVRAQSVTASFGRPVTSGLWARSTLLMTMLSRQAIFSAKSGSNAVTSANRKPSELAMLAQSYFPECTLKPEVCRLQQHPARNDSAWLGRLIVAVDNRRARRHLQNELPGEVFDASTTGSREIVLHHNKQPNDHACLGCVYPRDEAEVTHEQAVAAHLGIDVGSVRQPQISLEIARRICAKHTQLAPAEIEGFAFDTLYKQLCSSDQLKSGFWRAGSRPVRFCFRPCWGSLASRDYPASTRHR